MPKIRGLCLGCDYLIACKMNCTEDSMFMKIQIHMNITQSRPNALSVLVLLN